MPKPPAPAVPAADKPPRKPVDKLPAGAVRIDLESVTLDQEQAEALAFYDGGEPEGRRELARLARAALRDIVSSAIDDALPGLVKSLRDHRQQAELAEAERAEQEAIAKANALRAKLQQGVPSPLAQYGDAPGQASGGGRKSAVGDAP